MNVKNSTTTLTFTAPPLPDDVFTGIVVVMVTATGRYGIGPASEAATSRIESKYLHIAIRLHTHRIQLIG